jgi:hypothetical protein
MKDRDQFAVAAFRSALGVVDNAEAAILSDLLDLLDVTGRA